MNDLVQVPPPPPVPAPAEAAGATGDFPRADSSKESSKESSTEPTDRGLHAHARTEPAPVEENRGGSIGIGAPAGKALEKAPEPGQLEKTPEAGPSELATPQQDGVRKQLTVRVRQAFTAPEDGGTGLLRPPAIWTEPRPPLAEVWRRAKEAPWAPETGCLRTAGKAWSWITRYLIGALYLAAWSLEHPARTGLVVALAVSSALVAAVVVGSITAHF